MGWDFQLLGLGWEEEAGKGEMSVDEERGVEKIFFLKFVPLHSRPS